MPAIRNKQSFFSYNPYCYTYSAKYIYDLKNKCIFSSNTSPEKNNYFILDDNQTVIYKSNFNSNNKTIIRTYDSPKMMLDLSNFEIGKSCILHSNCILLTKEQIDTFLNYNTEIKFYNFDKYFNGHGNIKIDYRNDLYDFIINDLKELMHNKSVDTIYKIYRMNYGKCYSKILFLHYACKYFNLKIKYNKFSIRD